MCSDAEDITCKRFILSLKTLILYIRYEIKMVTQNMHIFAAESKGKQYIA